MEGCLQLLSVFHEALCSVPILSIAGIFCDVHFNLNFLVGQRLYGTIKTFKTLALSKLLHKDVLEGYQFEILINEVSLEEEQYLLTNMHQTGNRHSIDFRTVLEEKGICGSNYYL
jgi:hypothetical protein